MRVSSLKKAGKERAKPGIKGPVGRRARNTAGNRKSTKRRVNRKNDTVSRTRGRSNSRQQARRQSRRNRRRNKRRIRTRVWFAVTGFYKLRKRLRGEYRYIIRTLDKRIRAFTPVRTGKLRKSLVSPSVFQTISKIRVQPAILVSPFPAFRPAVKLDDTKLIYDNIAYARYVEPRRRMMLRAMVDVVKYVASRRITVRLTVIRRGKRIQLFTMRRVYFLTEFVTLIYSPDEPTHVGRTETSDATVSSSPAIFMEYVRSYRERMSTREFIFIGGTRTVGLATHVPNFIRYVQERQNAVNWVNDTNRSLLQYGVLERVELDVDRKHREVARRAAFPIDNRVGTLD